MNPKVSELQALMLAHLADEGRSHGLAVGRALDSVKQTTVGVGTVYKNLHMLERAGYVASSWEVERDERRPGPKRRYYQITTLGAEALDAYRAGLVPVARALGLRPRLT
jgi:DNA-binding PadR family transcriptional regulator